MSRTRRDLQRSNAMQHRDLVRLARENQRLRNVLLMIAVEVESTGGRFLVSRASLRAMADRVRALRWTPID